MNPLHHQEIFPNDGMPLVLFPAVLVAAAEEVVVDDSMILRNEEQQKVVSQQRRKQEEEEDDEQAVLHHNRALQPEDDQDDGGTDDEDVPTMDKEPPVEINVRSPSISAYPTESGTPPADAPYGDPPSFGDDGDNGGGGGGGDEGQRQPAIAPPAEGYNDYPPRPAPAQGDDKSSTAASNNANGDKGGPSPFLVLVILFAAVVALLVGYRAYKKYQRKREQHLMNLRSAQADQVLGDMQMIPSEDPDQELL